VYPVALNVRPTPEVERWRPLVLWLLTWPLSLVASLYLFVAVVLAFLGWFAALFTGRLPDSWGDLIAGSLRFYWRFNAYLYAFTTRYPAFGLPSGRPDPGGDEAVLFIGPPTELSRLTVFFRGVLAIPHFIVLYILRLVGGVILFIAWFAVLFTGRWPEGLRDFIIGLHRWESRVLAYTFLLVEEYPPFALD
jgi:hypothetical protein